MTYNWRCPLYPYDSRAETMDWHRNVHRQAYNHFLYRLNEHGPSTAYREQNRLPALKEWWDDLRGAHSKALQKTVQRLYDNLSRLSDAKEAGRKVGKLKWKPPHEYRSFTYNQSGFELKNTSGRTDNDVRYERTLWLSKIGEIPIRFHRELPDGATIKGVTVKKERTGRWYAYLRVEPADDPPEKPTNPKRTVGIDVGILKYVHDTDGTAVESLDLSAEQERLERAQRNLSRKEHGSANWEKQRKTVARRHADLKRKRHDFLHKLSAYYAREYDLVAVEKLDAKGLMELDGNSHNRVSAAWGTFRRMLKYKCKHEGTHYVPVDPRGTTKECAACGVETDKPLWVREHSCPSCGFTADRDWNASWNILVRGLKKVGTGCPESTLAETALPTGTTVAPAKRVVETGSPTLKCEPSGER